MLLKKNCNALLRILIQLLFSVTKGTLQVTRYFPTLHNNDNLLYVSNTINKSFAFKILISIIIKLTINSIRNITISALIFF